MKINKYLIKDIILSACAALIAAICIKTFVNAGNIVPGGFSGLSLLIIRVVKRFLNFEINYSLLYIAFNIPATILVLKATSKRFTLISLVDVVLTSVFVQFIPTVELTDDLLLIAVFGGIIGGLSSAIVLASNGCGGGSDFISIYFARKKHKSVWNEMFVFNALIILLSGAIFGWEAALYSIIYQFVNTQVVNAFDQRYKRSCVIIISEKSQDVAQAIYTTYHHAATIFDAVGGYTQTPRQVLYTIVGNYETQQLVKTILEIDPHAFINVSDTKRVIGNFHEKPF